MEIKDEEREPRDVRVFNQKESNQVGWEGASKSSFSLSPLLLLLLLPSLSSLLSISHSTFFFRVLSILSRIQRERESWEGSKREAIIDSDGSDGREPRREVGGAKLAKFYPFQRLYSAKVGGVGRENKERKKK